MLNSDLIHQLYSAVSDEARAYHNKTGYCLTSNMAERTCASMVIRFTRLVTG